MAERQGVLTKPREVAVGGLGKVSDAVREFSKNFLDDSKSEWFGYAESLATSIEGISDALRDMKMEDLVENSKVFVRKHPEAVVAGIFAAGIAFGRFLKTSKGLDFSGEKKPSHAEVH